MLVRDGTKPPHWSVTGKCIHAATQQLKNLSMQSFITRSLLPVAVIHQIKDDNTHHNSLNVLVPSRRVIGITETATLLPNLVWATKSWFSIQFREFSEIFVTTKSLVHKKSHAKVIWKAVHVQIKTFVLHSCVHNASIRCSISKILQLWFSIRIGIRKSWTLLSRSRLARTLHDLFHALSSRSNHHPLLLTVTNVSVNAQLLYLVPLRADWDLWGPWAEISQSNHHVMMF